MDANGPVRVREWTGPEELTILCVHGLGETLDDWVPAAEGLADHGRVLALDLPGFGRSPRGGRPTVVRVSAEVVSAVVDATPGPVVLVGSSYGGAVAVAVAASLPERVVGCVLTGSYLPPQLGGWEAPLIGAGLVLRQGRAVGMHLMDAARDPRERERIVRAFGRAREAEDRHPGRGLVEGVASLIALSVPTARAWELFERVRCPVLMVHGRGDRHVPAGWTRRVERRFPEWTAVRLDDEPHQVQIRDPGRWLGVVSGWLAEQGWPPRGAAR